MYEQLHTIKAAQENIQHLADCISLPIKSILNPMASPACKICLSVTETFTDKATHKIYHHCKHCEFIFVDPASLISPEKEKDRYLQHHNSPEHEGYVRMHLAFIELLKPYVKSQIFKALDFGCGPQPVLARLLEQTGVARQVVTYDKFFFPHISLTTDNCYELITCTEVLEHLDEPLSYLRLFKTLLTKDGILAFSTSFHTNSRSDFAKWWYKHDITHISFYSRQTIRWLARHFNFKLVFLNEKNCALFINA